MKWVSSTKHKIHSTKTNQINGREKLTKESTTTSSTNGGIVTIQMIKKRKREDREKEESTFGIGILGNSSISKVGRRKW